MTLLESFWMIQSPHYHGIRERVVARLVAEAKLRQVIIFTHDLVFYCQLIAEAERQEVEVLHQHIESLNSNVGLISDSQPWDALSVGNRLQVLDELIKRAEVYDEQGKPEEYSGVIARFYSRLRSTWERSIEEALFNRVVERYDKAVKAQRLTEVAVDSESIEAILKGWSRASGFIDAHDHAAAENKPLPTIAELRQDLTALKKFTEEQTKKRKAAKKMYKHLTR